MMSTYLKDNNVKVRDGRDVNSIMRDMMSVILENALDEEMNEELGYSRYDYRNKETDNRRNGHSQKTMHTSYGDMELDIPRDRKGEFEPQVIKKYQHTVTQDMEEKIISMYAKGMSTADIESHMRELYDIVISDSTISRIMDKILPIVKEWREIPLEDIYAVIFTDAIHYHVRQEGRIVKRAVYIAIGIDMNGRKDVLGMYVGQNESAKFWLSILNWLKNRRVEDILIACVDGLSGFPQAIANLATCFKYPEVVRRLIDTTNAMEGFNRQLRKVTKSKTIFPSDDSLLKMLYLAMMDITKKWTGHRQDWGQIHSQLEIFFEERLAGY
ncbi:IS256 family transposase [Clostridium sp. AM58-1XD]|uniref:IS256 family transposase n=1 Tax=Clostridium sp. AM58-1XD TaxID=2292307 RepID=UPI0015F449D8|nr:IS256 family transposase [Clostridium sp. AM58-1XD]